MSIPLIIATILLIVYWPRLSLQKQSLLIGVLAVLWVIILGIEHEQASLNQMLGRIAFAVIVAAPLIILFLKTCLLKGFRPKGIEVLCAVLLTIALGVLFLLDIALQSETRLMSQFDGQGGLVYRVWEETIPGFAGNDVCLKVDQYKRLAPSLLKHQKTFGYNTTNIPQSQRTKESLFGCGFRSRSDRDLMIRDIERYFGLKPLK